MTDHWPIERVLDQLMETLPWHTEVRAGVPHFVTGQHRAAPFATDDDETPVAFLLVYAPADGHSRAVILASYEDDKWDFVRTYVRFDGLGRGFRKLPDDFEPTEAMVETLDRARLVPGPGGFYLRGRA